MRRKYFKPHVHEKVNIPSMQRSNRTQEQSKHKLHQHNFKIGKESQKKKKSILKEVGPKPDSRSKGPEVSR